MKKIVLILACCLVFTGCSRNNEKPEISSGSLSSPESTYVISADDVSSAAQNSSSNTVSSSSSSTIKSSSSSTVKSSSSSTVKSSSSSTVSSSSSSTVKSSSSSTVKSSSSSTVKSSSSSTPAAPEVIGNYGRRAPEAREIEFADEVFDLINAERVKNGLPEFKEMNALTEAATVRAWECLIKYGHSRPDGAHFSTALTEQGVKWSACAENIAAGQQTPQKVIDSWMNSPGHRANILSDKYEYLGVGFYYDKDGLGGGLQYYWTQNFCNTR